MQGFVEPALIFAAIAFVWSNRDVPLTKSEQWVIYGLTLWAFFSHAFLLFLVVPAISEEEIPRFVKLGAPLFYAFEAWLFTRLAFICAAKFNLTEGGFTLLKEPLNLWRSLLAGLGGAFLAALLICLYSFLYGHPFFPDRPMPLLGVGTGLTNLAKEEILFRLGAQTMLLVLLGRFRYNNLVAILGSALLFEIWHNPLEAVNGLNFLISLTFAAIYQRYGYEASAIAHSLADVIVYAVLPMMKLFQ
jgi:hypothetical protein